MLNGTDYLLNGTNYLLNGTNYPLNGTDYLQYLLIHGLLIDNKTVYIIFSVLAANIR